MESKMFQFDSVKFIPIQNSLKNLGANLLRGQNEPS